MLYPVRARVSSPFGWRRIAGRDDLHTGLDFPAPRGELVHASAAGRVRLVAPPGEWQRYGLLVVLEHSAEPAPLYTLYAHLQTALVRPGELVQAGQPIATVGDTAGTRAEPDARTQRPHLHFELLTHWPPAGIDRDRIDPTPYLQGSPELHPIERAQRTGAGLAAVAFVALALWGWNKKRRRVSTPAPVPHNATWFWN